MKKVLALLILGFGLYLLLSKKKAYAEEILPEDIQQTIDNLTKPSIQKSDIKKIVEKAPLPKKAPPPTPKYKFICKKVRFMPQPFPLGLLIPPLENICASNEKELYEKIELRKKQYESNFPSKSIKVIIYPTL